MNQNWHSLPINIVVKRFDTNVATGLTVVEAQLRLQKFGPNSVPAPKRRSLLKKHCTLIKSLVLLNF